jgi:hypothetical protein
MYKYVVPFAAIGFFALPALAEPVSDPSGYERPSLLERNQDEGRIDPFVRNYRNVERSLDENNNRQICIEVKGASGGCNQEITGDSSRNVQIMIKKGNGTIYGEQYINDSSRVKQKMKLTAIEK